MSQGVYETLVIYFGTAAGRQLCTLVTRWRTTHVALRTALPLVAGFKIYDEN